MRKGDRSVDVETDLSQVRTAASEKHFFPRSVVLVGLLLLNLMAITGVVEGLKQLFDETIHESEIRSQNVALAIDLHLSNEINKIDLSLRTVSGQLYQWYFLMPEQNRLLAIRGLIQHQRMLLPEAESWTVTDAQGEIVGHDSDLGPATFSVADRKFFVDLKSGSAHGLVVSELQRSPMSGKPVLVFARAFRDSEGAFAGVVYVPLPLSYFERFLSHFEIGGDGVLVLRDANLEMIALVQSGGAWGTASVGDARITPELSRLLAVGKRHATYHAVAPFDDTERIISYRKVSNSPIHAFCGLSKAETLEQWRRIAREMTGFLILFLLISNGAAWGLWRQWRLQKQNAEFLRASNERLEHLAYYDALTGLPNRMLLADRMRQSLAECRRHGRSQVGICYLDLDGFKDVNDQWGHAFGNELLIEVARRLRNCTRGNDTVARLGGDEFVVLFCNLKDERDASEAVSRLLETSTEHYVLGEFRAPVTLSIGVTLFPAAGLDEPDALLRQADQAMYEAKRLGKNRMCFFDLESERRLREHQAHYSRLVDALANGEFRLHYQPKVNFRSGRIIGVEALIRWQHPERGLLLPQDFLSVIEETDLALPIGEWVLHEALEQQYLWRLQGLDIRVAVNLFGSHLQRIDFVESLNSILSAHAGFDPGALELEILETTALENLEEVVARISGCARLGVTFSLDDFGTGFSSLTYLRQLPVETVKIDRSFVREMSENQSDQAIVESIVAMAHALGRTVVAEGVETVEHGAFLVRCGCDYAQGYGIARPMPPDNFPDWVARWEMPLGWVREAAKEVIYFGTLLKNMDEKASMTTVQETPLNV